MTELKKLAANEKAEAVKQRNAGDNQKALAHMRKMKELDKAIEELYTQFPKLRSEEPKKEEP